MVILPFIIYFAIHGALYEMWFGTIGFNVSYLNSSVQQGSVIKQIILFLMYFFSGYSMAFVGMCEVLKKERRYIGIFCIILSVATSAMFLMGRQYPHYCLICLPYFIVSLIELKKNISAVTWWKIPVKKVIIMFSLLYLIGGVWHLKSIFQVFTNPVDDTGSIEEMVLSVPENARDCFILWNCPPYLYLKYNIKPCYKYFILQSSHGKINSLIEENMQNIFESGDAKWIMIQDGTQEIIQDVLDKYDIVKKTEDTLFLLYKQKQ